jgi:GT2 family glycosyltransferase
VKISVIIPTKNRADDLLRTLESLARQTHQPDEIIVVDQSSTPPFHSKTVPLSMNYIYDPHISGLTEARNLAMDRATGDVLLFLDDDVLLEPQYVEEILLAYSPDVTGVSGIITNYNLPSLSRRLFEKVFVRGTFHDDRQAIYWYANNLRLSGPQRVNQFTGAVMSFRAASIRGLRFDTKLTGGCLAEDIDFCARLPRGTVLVIAPKARLFHERSVVGRATGHWLEEHAQSSAYMRARNWHRGLGDDVCFAWLQVGYAVMATIGSLKRSSLEPFRAWQRGRAKGLSLGSQSANPSACGRAEVGPA